MSCDLCGNDVELSPDAVIKKIFFCEGDHPRKSLDCCTTCWMRAQGLLVPSVDVVEEQNAAG